MEISPNEILTFVQFGLALNIISFLIHLISSSISASRIGLMRTFEISQISLKIFREYKEVMLKHHKIKYYIEQFSIFVPFYVAWQLFIILINPRDCSYYERTSVLKEEKIKNLISEYGKD